MAFCGMDIREGMKERVPAISQRGNGFTAVVAYHLSVISDGVFSFTHFERMSLLQASHGLLTLSLLLLLSGLSLCHIHSPYSASPPPFSSHFLFIFCLCFLPPPPAVFIQDWNLFLHCMALELELFLLTLAFTPRCSVLVSDSVLSYSS